MDAIVSSLLSIVHCLLSIVFSLLSIVYCLKSIVYCLLSPKEGEREGKGTKPEEKGKRTNCLVLNGAGC